MDIWGIISLVFGIIGVLGSYWYVGIILCAVGLVSGIVGAIENGIDSVPSVMGVLLSVLGAVASVFFIASDLDSGALVLNARKFGGDMVATAKRDDDFMRFHREGVTPDQAAKEVSTESAEQTETNTEQEGKPTPYWVQDTDAEVPQNTNNDTPSVVAKTENSVEPINEADANSYVSKKDYIRACQEIPYKTLARNPESYKGTKIKLTVKVQQVVQGGWFDDNEYYRVYTNDEYGIWLGDEYFMYDDRQDRTPKILEGDVLNVYGECDGTTTVKRALTDMKEDVVSVKAKYIEILEESELDNQNNGDEQDGSGLTIGQSSAMESAKIYLGWQPFSYSGLINQLELEGFSNEDAIYAADNCGADWKENAAEKTKSYMQYSYTKDEMVERLEKDGFTHEQAVYGAEKNGY